MHAEPGRGGSPDGAPGARQGIDGARRRQDRRDGSRGRTGQGRPSGGRTGGLSTRRRQGPVVRGQEDMPRKASRDRLHPRLRHGRPTGRRRRGGGGGGVLPPLPQAGCRRVLHPRRRQRSRAFPARRTEEWEAGRHRVLFPPQVLQQMRNLTRRRERRQTLPVPGLRAAALQESSSGRNRRRSQGRQDTPGGKGLLAGKGACTASRAVSWNSGRPWRIVRPANSPRKPVSRRGP